MLGTILSFLNLCVFLSSNEITLNCFEGRNLKCCFFSFVFDFITAVYVIMFSVVFVDVNLSI